MAPEDGEVGGGGGGGGGGAAPAERRPRGRPSKTTKPPTLPHRGILPEPDEPDSRFELASDSPMTFKRMFTYYRNIAADALYFLCTRQGVTIVTRDTHRKMRVVTEIPGAVPGGGGLVNSYWCGKPSMLFKVNRADIADVFSSIDKTFWKISMSVRHDVPTELTITFKDHSIGKECINRARIERFKSIPETERDLFDARALARRRALDAADVSFRLTAKQFKKTIADATRRKTNHLIVEKLGAHPMQIIDKKDTSSGGETGYSEVYRDDALIQLESNIGAEDIMRCTFSVFVVKSLALALVTENVDFYCYRDEDEDTPILVLVSPIHEAAAADDDAASRAQRTGVFIASVVQDEEGP